MLIKMTIGILNAYNAENLGDQAIVQCTLAWCSRAFPEADALVFSHHYEANHRFFGRASRRPIGWLPPAGSRIERLIRPVFEILHYLTPGIAASETESAFNDCDFFILCGGGYLYSSKAPLLSRNLLLACWQGVAAVKSKRPIVLFPQSIGPLSKTIDRWAVQTLCRKTNLLMPRTEESLTTLCSWGLGHKSLLVPDIVLAMRKLCPSLYPPAESRKAGLGIAPIDLAFVPNISQGTMEAYLKKLENAAYRFYSVTREPVRLYLQVGIQGSDDDGNAITPLQEGLVARGVPVEIVDTKGDLKPYLASLAENRVFIGCRMHACIFSLTTFTPTIGLAYQPKFLGTFHSLNCSDWVLPIDSWSPDWLNRRIDEAVTDDGTLIRSLKQRIEKASVGIVALLDRAKETWSNDYQNGTV